MVVKSPDPPQPNPFAGFVATSSAGVRPETKEPESKMHPGAIAPDSTSYSATLQDEVESSKCKKKGVASDQRPLDLYTSMVLYELARTKEAKEEMRVNILPVICQSLDQISCVKTDLDAFSEVSDVFEFLTVLYPSDPDFEEWTSEYRKAETQVQEGFALMREAKEKLQSVLATKL